MVAAAGDAPAARAVALADRLGRIGDLRTRVVEAAPLDWQALRLHLGEHDVVHWIGARGIDIELLTLAPKAPRLIVLEACATGVDGRASDAAEPVLGLARAVCRSGQALLVLDAAAPPNADLEFVAGLYALLERGERVAEAVRAVRAQCLQAACPSAAAGPALRLYGDGGPAVLAASAPQTQGDHLRQLTVMSYDLVDSTHLISRLGAERYSDALEQFHRVCGGVLARHGGFSDDPQGDDGIMCYFGFPTAHEDSVLRALRAGLDVIESVRALDLSVRIGVSTGPVVVKSGQPVGATVHLAARLQSVAAPDTLVASEATRLIARDRFSFRQLAVVASLKGFERPGALYEVLHEIGTDEIPRDTAARSATPFIARETELGLMAHQWALARAGTIRSVLISGEAGIGKSRLVREFRQSAAIQRARTFEVRCTSNHAHTPFYPLLQAMRGLLQLRDADTLEAKHRRIEAGLAGQVQAEHAADLIAALLSVPPLAGCERLDFPPTSAAN